MIRRAYWIGALLIVLGLFIGDTRAQTPEAKVLVPGQCYSTEALGLKQGGVYVAVPREKYEAQLKFIRKQVDLMRRAEEIILKQEEELRSYRARLRNMI